MASKSTSSGEDGVRGLFWPIHAVLHFAVWLVVVIFLSIVTAVVFAVGVQQEKMPSRYIADLVDYYTAQAPNQAVADSVVEGARALVFGWPGVEDIVSTRENSSPTSNFFGLASRVGARKDGRQMLLVVVHSVELVALRILLLFSGIPAFVLLVLVAFVDGLVARYVRRECGGHESATRHTRAKRLLNRALLPSMTLVWMVSPVEMSLWATFLPMVICIAGLVWVMAKYFKKYL